MFFKYDYFFINEKQCFIKIMNKTESRDGKIRLIK